MNKFLTSLFILSILLATTVSTVYAQDTTLITGTVQSVTLETDGTTGETTVNVSILDDQGNTQTVSLSVETAVSLGLVTVDPTTNEPTVADGVTDTNIEIDPTTVLDPATDGEDTTTEPEHPVGSLLAGFFEDTTNVDYASIMEYHENGTGFGVIAQALWMTQNMEGDATLFQLILDAKLSGDYSSITLSDGSTPENWGQFKKALKGMNDEAIKSVGQARQGLDVERVQKKQITKKENSNNGNSQSNGNGQGNSNSNGQGNGNNNGQGNSNNNGQGNGNSNGQGNNNGNGGNQDNGGGNGNGGGNNRP